MSGSHFNPGDLHKFPGFFVFMLALSMPFVSHLGTMGNTPIKDGGPAFPMQDASAIHAYASARVEGVVGADERDRVYIKAKAEAIGGICNGIRWRHVPLIRAKRAEKGTA